MNGVLGTPGVEELSSGNAIFYGVYDIYGTFYSLPCYARINKVTKRLKAKKINKN